MNVIEDIKADLRRAESVRRDLYDDATGQPITRRYLVQGNPTIGVGRCLTKNPLSSSEIEYLLDNDVKRIYQFCWDTFPWFNNLNDMQKRGIVNMVFQIGQTGFLQFKDLIAAMEKGDYAAAKEAGMDSAWFKVETTGRAQSTLNMLA